MNEYRKFIEASKRRNAEIRRLVKAGVLMRIIAAQYCITIQRVSKIVKANGKG